MEKQKILQGSISKSTHLQMEENHALAKNNTGNRIPTKPAYINGSAEKKISLISPTPEKSGISLSSNSLVAESGGRSSAIGDVKSVARTKKHSGGVNFFDRYLSISFCSISDSFYFECLLLI